MPGFQAMSVTSMQFPEVAFKNRREQWHPCAPKRPLAVEEAAPHGSSPFIPSRLTFAAVIQSTTAISIPTL
jgi:hypothetical protein